MSEIRALTKKEQLEWLLNFLYEQKEFIEEYIKATETELKLEKNKEDKLFFHQILVKIILMIKNLNKI